MSEAPKTTLSRLRHRTLSHIQGINDGQRCGARCPYGEMIVEANDLIRDGLSEWRKDLHGEGRWLTPEGRAVLDAAGPFL